TPSSPLSLHDALPTSRQPRAGPRHRPARVDPTRPGRQRAAARRPPRLGAPGEAGGTRVSDKPEIRERVWALLTARRVARFPLPLDERIPNFTGAERAAERLAETPEWKAATRLKCNPDAPQRPVRLRALSEGKLVFMAVPRLRDERCFLRLDPAKLGRRVAEAATIAGAARPGEPGETESLAAFDLGGHGSGGGGRTPTDPASTALG